MNIHLYIILNNVLCKLQQQPHKCRHIVLQGSASECVLITMLAARYTTLKGLKNRFPFVDDGILLPKLVAYSSKLVSRYYYKQKYICTCITKTTSFNIQYFCIITDMLNWSASQLAHLLPNTTFLADYFFNHIEKRNALLKTSNRIQC